MCICYTYRISQLKLATFHNRQWLVSTILNHTAVEYHIMREEERRRPHTIQDSHQKAKQAHIKTSVHGQQTPPKRSRSYVRGFQKSEITMCQGTEPWAGPWSTVALTKGVKIPSKWRGQNHNVVFQSCNYYMIALEKKLFPLGNKFTSMPPALPKSFRESPQW